MRVIRQCMLLFKGEKGLLLVNTSRMLSLDWSHTLASPYMRVQFEKNIRSLLVLGFKSLSLILLLSFAIVLHYRKAFPVFVHSSEDLEEMLVMFRVKLCFRCFS